MKKSLLFFLFISFALFWLSCNNSGSERAVAGSAASAIDTVRMSADSTVKAAPTTKMADSLELRHRFERSSASVTTSGSTWSAAIQKPAMGSVAYYCPTRMIKDQEYYVTVSIGREQLDSLRAIEIQLATKLNVHINPADVKGDSIRLSPRMKVILTCSPDYFKNIDSAQILDEQDFGNADHLDWEWLIQPTAVVDKIPIEIRIYAFNLQNDGKWTQVNPPLKSFSVNVRIDPRTLWDKSLTFISDNPKFLLAQILIPLFTFFGGVLFGRRKKST
jgi:hypothetical protein